MSKVVFIFSTPEGGGQELAEYLRADDTKVIGGRENFPPLWKPIDELNALPSIAGLHTFAEGYFLAKFEETDDYDRIIFLDFYTGWAMGYLHKLSMWILTYMPDAKVVFCRKNADNNLARALASSKDWFPHYATCGTELEWRIKNQISQQNDVAEFYPENTFVLENLESQKEELNAFLN